MSINFSEYFYYDESSPSCLRWNKNIYYGRYKTMLKVGIGDKAGSKDIEGYWQVKLAGKVHKVHRIVWELKVGKIDKNEQIDHVDGIRGNNLISNLRTVSCKINSRNRGMQSNNKTGVVGVSFNESRNTYRSQYVGLDGKCVLKFFKVSDYGKEKAFELACEFRFTNMKLLNLLGEGYTERHVQEKLK